MTTIVADVQETEPPYVTVTVTGFTDTVTPVTVYRVVSGAETPVRGAIEVSPEGGAIVRDDLEAPFGVAVTYVARQAGQADVYSSAVTLVVASPWISHPITGDAVAVTIAEWTELSYSARRSVIPVAGRRSPVVVSDVRLAPESKPVLLTRTRSDLLGLRELLATGDVLLLRPKCDAVEPDWIAVGDVSEQRVKPSSRAIDPRPAGSDWRRLVTLAVQHVAQPFPRVGAVANTLADLNTYEPTTLQAINDRFPGTLLDIARANLAVVS